MKLWISEILEQKENPWQVSIAEQREADQVQIDGKAVLQRVNQSLNANPRERKIYMKQKLMKVAVTVVALLGITGATAVAASNVDLIKEFFTGDNHGVEDQVKTPKVSASDANLKITSEQVLVDEHNAMLIFSVEALNSKGKDILNEKANADSLFSIDMSIRPQEGSAFSYTSVGIRSMQEKSTPDKRYWALDIGNAVMDNRKGEQVEVYPNKEQYPDLHVTVHLQSNLETKKVLLQAPALYRNQAYTIEQVDISPLGLVVQGSAAKGLQDLPEGQLFFRMKDGSVKTKNQLININSWSSYQNFQESETSTLRQNGRFQTPVDPEDFISIIVDGIEYPIDDTSKYKKVEIDRLQKTFEFKPLVQDDHVALPVAALCQRLGAAYEWDEKTQQATIAYRGVTTVLTLGSSLALRDGEAVDLLDPPTIYQGQLIASTNLMSECLNIGVERTNTKNPDPNAWTWIITP